MADVEEDSKNSLTTNVKDIRKSHDDNYSQIQEQQSTTGSLDTCIYHKSNEYAKTVQPTFEN